MALSPVVKGQRCDAKRHPCCCVNGREVINNLHERPLDGTRIVPEQARQASCPIRNRRPEGWNAHKKVLRNQETSGLHAVRCRRGDLNPHALAGTSPSSWRVCLFRHSDVGSARRPGDGPW
jgi:hypothetical protein